MSTQLPKKEESCCNVVDANLFKKNKKLQIDKTWDDIITKLVIGHKKTDEELKELAKICCKESDVEQNT